uniref:Uncharacterized protein n=1 Tax=Takifugu rubripes TaxID=31033 RepID=A0A674P8V4_TAKRU
RAVIGGVGGGRVISFAFKHFTQTHMWAHTHTHTLILMIYNNLKPCQIFLIGPFFPQKRGPTVWHPFIFLYNVLCHLTVLLSLSIYSYTFSVYITVRRVWYETKRR